VVVVGRTTNERVPDRQARGNGVRALEPRVPRPRVHDEPEPQGAPEGDRGFDVRPRQRDLVQVQGAAERAKEPVRFAEPLFAEHADAGTLGQGSRHPSAGTPAPPAPS